MSESLARDLGRALFAGAGLDLGVWLLVTGALLCFAALGLGLLRSYTDAMAVTMLTRPRSVAWWVLGSAIGTVATFSLLVVSYVGVPLAVIVGLLVVPVLAVFGYAALAQAIASRIAGDWQTRLAGISLTLLTIVILRAVRLVPAVGGIIHGVVVLVGYALAVLTLWELLRSWHERRMPDVEQFPDAVIEWEQPTDEDSDSR